MSDLVFRERPQGGLEFVGDFEGLYRAEADPWRQAGGDGDIADYYRYSRQQMIQQLARLGISESGIEFGCGHGHVTDCLRRRIAPDMVGADISTAAIERAQVLYPRCSFVIRDLTADDFAEPGQFDFAVLGQMLWYVLHRIDIALVNAVSCVKAGGLLVISQAFLKGEQRYGAEIADGFPGALRLLLSKAEPLRLQLVESRYDDSGLRVHNDGLIVLRKVG